MPFLQFLSVHWLFFGFEWRMAPGLYPHLYLDYGGVAPGVLMQKGDGEFYPEKQSFLEASHQFFGRGLVKSNFLQIQKRVVEHLSSSNSDFEQARKSYNVAKEGAVNLMMFFSFLSQIFCVSGDLVCQSRLTDGWSFDCQSSHFWTLSSLLCSFLSITKSHEHIKILRRILMLSYAEPHQIWPKRLSGLIWTSLSWVGRT